MKVLRQSFIVVLTACSGLGLFAPASLAYAEDCADLLSPYLANFDSDTSSWLDQFRVPGLILESLDYAVSSGYLIDDVSSNFLPAIQSLPKTSRLIRQTPIGTAIERGVSFDFLVNQHEQGLAALTRGYNKSVQSDLALVVREVEKSLPKEFSSVGIVRDAKTGLVLGFLRLYSAHMRNQNVILPASEIARRLGHFRAEDENLLREILAPGSDRNSGQLAYLRNLLIEIGQYWIDLNCTAETRSSVKRLLMQWAYGKLVELTQISGAFRVSTAPASALVHVASDRHKVLYRRDFGISEIIWEHSLANLEDQEVFLTITVDRLLQNLEKWIKAPSN